jgi:hypothetical protein
VDDMQLVAFGWYISMDCVMRICKK